MKIVPYCQRQNVRQRMYTTQVYVYVYMYTENVVSGDIIMAYVDNR